MESVETWGIMRRSLRERVPLRLPSMSEAMRLRLSFRAPWGARNTRGPQRTGFGFRWMRCGWTSRMCSIRWVHFRLGLARRSADWTAFARQRQGSARLTLSRRQRCARRLVGPRRRATSARRNQVLSRSCSRRGRFRWASWRAYEAGRRPMTHLYLRRRDWRGL